MCATQSRGVVAGGQEGVWPLYFFRNRWIFGNFTDSSENFRTSAVGKDKGFEFYRKIFELAPPLLHRCHDAPDSGQILCFKDHWRDQTQNLPVWVSVIQSCLFETQKLPVCLNTATFLSLLYMSCNLSSGDLSALNYRNLEILDSSYPKNREILPKARRYHEFVGIPDEKLCLANRL